MADGVGGWADVGVDTGKYAREFMSHNQQLLFAKSHKVMLI
jgi:hypothetical protein